MPRNIPAGLAARFQHCTTLCRALKISPLNAPAFGITSLNRDVEFDDGGGLLTYRCAKGYTPSDTVTKTDLSVNNAEAAGLVAQYPLDGVTIDAINSGVYDGAPFIEYLIDYMLPSAGGVIINSGTIGQITTTDSLACKVELRSYMQTLKQSNMVELTSITCRARFGDARCKIALTWYRGKVSSIGSEDDRVFNFVPGDPDSSGYTPAEEQYMTSAGYVFPAAVGGFNFFEPGIVHWDTGAYAGMESEIESFNPATNTVTLAIPVPDTINAGDTFRIRQDCSKSRDMCINRWNNLLNMRAEPDIPLGNGTDLQSPTPQQ